MKRPSIFTDHFSSAIYLSKAVARLLRTATTQSVKATRQSQSLSLPRHSFDVAAMPSLALAFFTSLVLITLSVFAIMASRGILTKLLRSLCSPWITTCYVFCLSRIGLPLGRRIYRTCGVCWYSMRSYSCSCFSINADTFARSYGVVLGMWKKWLLQP